MYLHGLHSLKLPKVLYLTVEFIDSQKSHWVPFQALHHLYIFVGFYVATGKIHENVLFQVLLSLHISGGDGGINFQVSTE